MPSSVLVLLTSLILVCSALQPQWPYQTGSPLSKNFTPGRNLIASGVFHISDVLGEFGSFDQKLKRDTGNQACGSNLLAQCSDDPTTCCEIGGECCGGGKCCPSGRVCQANAQGDSICCAKGEDCGTTLPDNPCIDQTAIPCVNYDFCCPKGNVCSVVNGKQLCAPNGGGSLTSTPPPTSTSAQKPTTLTPAPTTALTRTSTSSATIAIVTESTPLQQSVVTTALASPTKETTITTHTAFTSSLSKEIEKKYTTRTANRATADPTLTIVEYTTIASSFEVSSGVYSPTTLVVYTTHVFAPESTESTESAESTDSTDSTDSTSSAVSSPAPHRSRKKDFRVAIIAGASIGGVLFLLAIGFLVFFCIRRSRIEPEPEFIPTPVREPTLPILSSRLGNKHWDISTRQISKPLPPTSPMPRYNSVYGIHSLTYSGQSPAEVHSEEYYQLQEIGVAQKYKYPATTYEPPPQRLPVNYPYLQRSGQSYNRNIG